jgi:hypothetical protein
LDIIWNGINVAGALDESEARHRHELADAAKTYDWPRMMAVLNAHPEFVNTTRPGGDTLYAPLHQVAHGGAPAGL